MRAILSVKYSEKELHNVSNEECSGSKNKICQIKTNFNSNTFLLRNGDTEQWPTASVGLYLWVLIIMALYLIFTLFYLFQLHHTASLQAHKWQKLL